jgi:regulator of protease activity HflC (stomatin/prohibitin superfamily)
MRYDIVATQIGANHMENRSRQFIPGLSVLLLALLLFSGLGLLLQDSRGVAYGPVGALIWGGAVAVTFLLGIVYLSRWLLPLRGNIGWSEGFSLLLRNYLLGITSFIYGQDRTSPDDLAMKKKAPVTELPPSFKYLGAGMLPSHQAAAIMRGRSFSRATGPGLVFLEPGESIGRVFDLRPQARRQSVSANTRDGIPVETSVTVLFQVRRPSTPPRPGREAEAKKIPYAYSSEAIFDLSYTGGMTGDLDRQEWTDQVAPQAASLLVNELSGYTLDELLIGAGTEVLDQVRQNIKDALERQQGTDEQQSLSRGIEILGVGVGALQLSDEVLEKRLQTWQVEWQNRATQERVTGEIESHRLFHQARARAQIENVENLLISIDAMHQQSQAELHEVVMMRLMEVLETMSAEKTLDSMVTRPLLTSLAQEATSEMQTVLERSEE